MTSKMKTNDPDIRGSLPAMKRAAKSALALGKKTQTPVFVMKNGRVVNLNPVRTKQRRKAMA